ncbi:protein FAR1-RELATED SEQUENCE 6-like [Silene latifolia]|uniref:protein FAR1-RELATED SEQUENCE 6-like n=1 Tax=Silene latifolia TaxID=37657 RepID=UPI003D775147
MANTDVEEVDPPTEGMTFANGDEFGAYCYLYAYQRGFQFFIRINKILDCYTEKGVKRHGSGNSEPRFYKMNRIRLCCTRGADPSKKNGLEHNHDDVDPANSRHMVGYRLWHEYFRRRAIMNDEAGISIAKNFNTLVREVGGHANLPIKERDLRNMINQERRRSRINGDANALEEKFIKLREIDPDFYCSIQTDKEGKLLNVFWADGRCRGMAKVFADAVSYDATFLCNRYKMSFTPFVGVNHHGSTVVLASALISHEDAISFTWVFKRWLDCMGRAPSVIITDQCRGIGKAVKDVFPNTPHRLCLWHMMRNGAKNLVANPRYNEIKADLTDVVYESKDIHDFEDAWELFVVKYGLREHSWVKEVYAKREAWVPLYDKNVIVEEVFQRAYSNSMFAKVKKEVYGLINTNAEIKMNIGTFSLFVVTEKVKHPIWKPRDKMYDVSIDTASGEFTCTCQRFEFKGILCRHIIRALLLKKVQLIPDKYILSRFRKDLVRGYEHIQVGYHTPAESKHLKRSIAVTLRNGYLYRLALHSDEAFVLYNRESQKLVKELEATVGIEI